MCLIQTRSLLDWFRTWTIVSWSSCFICILVSSLLLNRCLSSVTFPSRPSLIFYWLAVNGRFLANVTTKWMCSDCIPQILSSRPKTMFFGSSLSSSCGFLGRQLSIENCGIALLISKSSTLPNQSSTLASSSIIISVFTLLMLLFDAL